MAELLIMARTVTHANPAISARDCWKLGDVVTVKADGASWGLKEGPPRFWLVKCAGVTVEEAQGWVAKGANRRRDYQTDQSTLPTPIRNALNAGPVTVTRAQLMAAMKVKG